jgi:hypothetical protein
VVICKKSRRGCFLRGDIIYYIKTPLLIKKRVAFIGQQSDNRKRSEKFFTSKTFDTVFFSGADNDKILGLC